MMRHHLLWALAAVILIAGGVPVLAGDPHETAIGNTVSVTRGGVETRYYYNENGAVTMATSTGESDVGEWIRKGNTVCTTWAGSGEDNCYEVPDQEVSLGETVEVPGPDGETVKTTYMEGKVPFN